jgi:hypothetical protein
MRVRALRHAEGTIAAFDTGRFLRASGDDDTPPCQVQWDDYGEIFSVHWHDVEIIGPPTRGLSAVSTAPPRPAPLGPSLDLIRLLQRLPSGERICPGQTELMYHGTDSRAAQLIVCRYDSCE